MPLFLVAVILTSLFLDTAWPLIAVSLWGIAMLCRESWARVRRGKWNLDYLAFLTLFVALCLDAWLAGAVISLMVTVSASLERYGTERAEETLKKLFHAIPKTIILSQGGKEHEISLHAVRPGDELLIRAGEMLPLEGSLLGETAIFDESNITGEAEPSLYRKGSHLKAGLVNRGEAVLVKARGDFEHSSYRRILDIVEKGKVHPAPLVRLSERYNFYFTSFALAIAFGAYFFSGDWTRFLAVLVIATPCPLLIAAPLSFLGGLNRAARQNIIIKSPFILELLAKTKILFFDKTGTLTLGEPRLRSVIIHDKHLDEEEALTLAASLERHSLHPLAKTLVREQDKAGGEFLHTEDVHEKYGEGISGKIGRHQFTLRKARRNEKEGIHVELLCEKKRVASFFFDDTLKPEVTEVLEYLKERDYQLGILTGDQAGNAKRILGKFGLPIYSGATPERKASLIQRFQKEGALVGMVGDGMNDAPALALADLGIVFSGNESAASLEAADVAILGRDAIRIRDAIHIGRRSYHVAFQSIFLGMGLSTIGMTAAFFGFIDPVHGALLQELIDFCVIMNALRSTY